MFEEEEEDEDEEDVIDPTSSSSSSSCLPLNIFHNGCSAALSSLSRVLATNSLITSSLSVISLFYLRKKRAGGADKSLKRWRTDC